MSFAIKKRKKNRSDVPTLELDHEFDTLAPWRYSESDTVTFTRASIKTVDTELINSHTLEQIAVDVHPQVTRKSANGLLFKGLELEATSTQRARDSNTPVTGAWTKRGAMTTGITQNTSDITDPLGTNTANKVVGLGASSVDDFFRTAVGFDANEKIACSFWIYPISTSGELRIRNVNDVNRGSWRIDLSNLPTGRWTRITRLSSGVIFDTEWQATSGGNSGVWFNVVSGTVDFYFWGFQLEAQRNKYFATSTILPHADTTAVVRAADSAVVYDGLANLGGVGSEKQGTVIFDMLVRDHTPEAQQTICSISDGGDTNNSIYFILNTDKTMNCVSLATGGQPGLVTLGNVCDNVVRRVQVSWKEGKLSLFLYSGLTGEMSFSTPDTNVTPPSNLDTISLGLTGHNAVTSHWHFFRRYHNFPVYCKCMLS